MTTPDPWQQLCWQAPSLGLQQTALRLSEGALGGHTYLAVGAATAEAAAAAAATVGGAYSALAAADDAAVGAPGGCEGLALSPAGVARPRDRAVDDAAQVGQAQREE